MPLSFNTKGAFTATGEGCDPIVSGGCRTIMVSSGSSFSEGSLDVSTSSPYAQSVSVPLLVLSVNLP